MTSCGYSIYEFLVCLRQWHLSCSEKIFVTEKIELFNYILRHGKVSLISEYQMTHSNDQIIDSSQGSRKFYHAVDLFGIK